MYTLKSNGKNLTNHSRYVSLLNSSSHPHCIGYEVFLRYDNGVGHDIDKMK